MLQRTVAFILLCSSVAMHLSGLLVFAGFELNKGYIASELCVNRSRPEMHCNGRCYLMKKLKQAQDKEQKQSNELHKIQLQQAIIVLPFAFRACIAEPAQYVFPLTTGLPVSRNKNIFHPPQYV